MSQAGNRPVAPSPAALVQKSGDRELRASIFGYERPSDMSKPKGIVPLCRSDVVYSTVQVLKHGGENNLHAHTAQDGIWIVLRGRVRFYGKDDAVLAELGPLQGIHLPRGFYYRFESAGEETLELLQVEAIDKTIENRRLDATLRKDPEAHVQQF